MNYIHYIIVTVAFLLIGGTNAIAQTDRNLIRQGNRAFKSQKWAAAETQYRKAISKNQKNPQAIYNLGCALLAQQKDSLAMVQFGNAAQLESNIFRRSKSYHNMGVVMQNHREYAQAIEYYKMALRCNPQDNETRYNLALCKKLLKNNQQNQNNKNNKDKNKNDKNKDKKNDKNKNKDGQNKNDQNKDKQNKNQDKNNSDKNKQNQEKMSRDNAEQLLNAAIQQEKATKRKMQKAMSQPRRKVYDKNW
ncbi:tetratricopeptide repeat protein [Segatella copri]|uniref:tetratricopeptide repeat protein n=1 Tax=Segatella copri TaxID=165179 RepID=UPI001C3933F9|nr:tetratricopeptide repeat protein [Segatella copri]MBV3400216.1 tetratricopeptide repeat protein [Segatella copri]MBW0049065.1 tetratricopeptide repeat protein [Segatella copri]